MVPVNRAPAWPGESPPSKPRFQYELTEREVRWLTKNVLLPVFGIDPSSVRTLRPTANGECCRHGHFLITSSKKRKFFLRIKPLHDYAAHLAACRIAEYLSKSGAPVLAPLRPAAGWSATAVEDAVAIVVPFADTRHTNYSANDCQALGQALGKLHNALTNYPETLDIEAHTAAFDAVIMEERYAALSGHLAHLPPSLQQVTTEAAQLYQPSFWATEQYCCHGDITPGNVLFDPSGSALILDFEDAAFSYRSILFDIASALLRFAKPSRFGFEGRTEALLQSYEHTRGFCVAGARLERAMAMLVAHNILVLSLANRHSPGVLLPDWHKFLPMWNLAIIRGQKVS